MSVRVVAVDECLDRYRRTQGKSLSQARESLKLLSAMWTFGKRHFKDESGQKLLGENPVKALKEQIKRWDYNPNPNIEDKRNIYTGDTAESQDKAAIFASFLAKEGLTLQDGRTLINHLEGKGTNPTRLRVCRGE